MESLGIVDNNGGREAGTVLVTVGSTKFDDLIRAVDKQAFADALVAHGHRRLVVQVGFLFRVNWKVLIRGENKPDLRESRSSTERLSNASIQVCNLWDQMWANSTQQKMPSTQPKT